MRIPCLPRVEPLTSATNGHPPLSVRSRGRVRPHEEHTLLARLEAARQVYNACLGEARQRVRLVRESKVFQQARTLSRDNPERQRLFRAARAQHGFSDFTLQASAQQFGHAWL